MSRTSEGSRKIVKGSVPLTADSLIVGIMAGRQLSRGSECDEDDPMLDGL